MAEQGKVFNDPIHGHVQLHPLLVKIIDTPQFQRLRYIKQLGGAYFVYPGASHNRFEHSIGVAYLAGQLVEALSQRQPHLNITEEDILCVKIAGLCHDLGHGPFSHMYDGMFIPKARPGTTWKHERASVQMFHYLVRNNNLELEHYNLGPNDLVFIREMIEGPQNPAAQGNKWPYEGRERNKSFLYDIVANKRTGIDVDKFDYFARDCHHLGIKNTFDHHRFMMFARVCEVNGETQICCRDKEVYNLYDMFYTRYSLHVRAYKHKVNIIVQEMISDAFLGADPFIQIEGSQGRIFSLSTAINDMEAYTKLTDRVFEEILHSSSEELQEAREILKRIISRDIYQFLGKRGVDEPYRDQGIIETWKRQLARNSVLTPEDFKIVVINLDYGMGDKDPMTNMHFYSKSDPDTISDICKDNVRTKLSVIIPSVFSEHFVMVYCKKTDEESLRVARQRFEEWSRAELTIPQGN